MYKKYLLTLSSFFCLLLILVVPAGISANEDKQVSVDGIHFHVDQFFGIHGVGFEKEKVNFQKGWLGIFMENAGEDGILVIGTSEGSPAAEAGLKNGDLITKINNDSTIDPDGQNLIQFKKKIEAMGAGGIPELTITREGSVMLLKPKLVAKLLEDVPEPVLPAFARMKPGKKEQVDMQEGSIAESTKDGGSQTNTYRETKGAAKKITETKPTFKSAHTDFLHFVMKNENYKGLLGTLLQRIGEEIYVREGFQSSYTANPFRLSLINYLMLHPFETHRIGRGVCNEFTNKDICEQIHVAAELLDIKASLEIATTTVPESLQDRLQSVIDVLPETVLLVKNAFRNLSMEEYDFLYQHTRKIWHPDERIPSPILAELLSSSRKVEIANFLKAATRLLNKIKVLEKTPSNEMQITLTSFLLPESFQNDTIKGPPSSVTYSEKDYAGDILFVQDTDIGKIVVGGTGTSYYYADAAVIIDLGGHDYYFNNAGTSSRDIPVSLCIDFSGDDVYNSARSFSQGTGQFGIGILCDFLGNDTYTSDNFSQGASLFGVGVLLDFEGNDLYRGHALNQGNGFFGVGMLHDHRGNDIYCSSIFAQGIGFTKGIGLLLDSHGNDRYFVGGGYPDFREPEKSFQAMSHGMGMGIRPEESIVGASGGIGILIDQKGSDQYHGDYFSQGSGYYFSLGILNDYEGDDKYYAGRYSQGAGIHSAIGLLEDLSGNDSYECTFGVSQGCGHDTGVGFLVDACGDDDYQSITTSQGVALEKAIGVLVDFQGNDRYQARERSQGASAPSKTEGIISAGIFVDNQGVNDIFHETIGENLLLYRSNGGIVLNKQ